MYINAADIETRHQPVAPAYEMGRRSHGVVYPQGNRRGKMDQIRI
ncbi:hypothetical protein AA0243_0116 [Novacetimonas hansenii NRIC 0243]|nr:hypothetical protein AA0243_0116 [Novacetimonas hansenii NRIC 0243]